MPAGCLDGQRGEAPRAPAGFFNVDKPPGLTSFAVVAALRRIVGVRRMGHLGTLDPAARGVLPVAVGAATRLIEYVSGDKSYRAELTLGVATDTLDAEGQVLERRDWSGVDEAAIRAALPAFRGEQQQVPPMASALHHEGRRLYEWFRRGRKVEVAPRAVRIHRLELVEVDLPRLVIEVDCGAGTYIRSLARDLGERLGCGAHLSALVRTRSGPFALHEARTLDEIRAAGGTGMLVPAAHVLADRRWLALNPDGARRAACGGRIGPREVEDPEAWSNLETGASDGVVMLAGPSGELIAAGKMAAWEAEVGIQPIKVFAPPIV